MIYNHNFNSNQYNQNGRVYNREVFENAIEEYLNRIKVKKRENIIDNILEDKEYKEEDPLGVSQRGYLDKYGDYKILSYDFVGDSWKVDVEYKPSTSIQNINHSISITSSNNF
jgi:hypothetical protein